MSEHLGPGHLPSLAVANGELPLPPVVTKTWFHTGAWNKKQTLLAAYEAEWFSGNAVEPRLPTGTMPKGLSAVELHQAHRALAGRMLRQEIYAEDGTVKRASPTSSRSNLGAFVASSQPDTRPTLPF